MKRRAAKTRGLSRRGASGRFLLRIDPALHEALRRKARECGLSLNDYCARRLAAPGGASDAGDAAPALRHAAALFGEQLLGVVLFGSYARGDAGTASDVDLLLVLDEPVPLSRALYRQWDTEAVSWENRPVEPHFVHLPNPSAVTGGVWAEAALDGIVLFERRMTVSRHLADVRRQVLSGRLVRRLVHGQPYWAEVA